MPIVENSGSVTTARKKTGRCETQHPAKDPWIKDWQIKHNIPVNWSTSGTNYNTLRLHGINEDEASYLHNRLQPTK